MKNEEQWWFPKKTDEQWMEQIRKDYPENADWSDESLRDHYANGRKYENTWDHVGDAADEHEKLADSYLDAIEVINAAYWQLLPFLKPGDEKTKAVLEQLQKFL